MTDKKWKIIDLFIYTYEIDQNICILIQYILSHFTIVKWKDIIIDINDFF